MFTNTALVLGCTGQDGSLICQSLLKKGYKVIGLSRTETRNIKNHIQLGIDQEFEIQKGDIKNQKAVERLITTFQPDSIFNLAAQSSVGRSIHEPIDTIHGIVNGTLNILEASRKLNYSGKIFFAGSSEMFGYTSVKANIAHRQDPISPYAIGKQTSFNLVKLYRDIHKLKCVTGVLFNHESHLRNENFVTQKIIKYACEIKRNKSIRLQLGNIDVIRDWGWAPEYVEAIQIVLKSEKLKDYVICSGKANSLRLFIEKVFSHYELDWRQYVDIDKNLIRPNEIAKSIGDPEPLFKDLGWKAKENFDSMIEKLINLSSEKK